VTIPVRGVVEFGKALYETLFVVPFRAESHVSVVFTCQSHSLEALLGVTMKKPLPNPAAIVPEVGDNVYTQACFETTVVGLVWAGPSLQATVSAAIRIGASVFIVAFASS
jgi:hypothetical protein